MQANLSPSVNILRDAARPFHYFPTPNSRLIYEQIAATFKSGSRAFSIIGSYGTGKSAFLLALIQQFQNPDKQTFGFVNGAFNHLQQFEVISIVGELRSLMSAFAENLQVEVNSKDISNALKKKREYLKKTNTCCVIVIDEFGKFLEFAAKNNPAAELYFIQELAELVCNPDYNYLLLTTLHQNFDAYSLTPTEQKEWEKVKGRFKELTFNEPVEQLLRLAGDFLMAQQVQIAPAIDSKWLNLMTRASVFRMNLELTESLSQKIYPFDLLSAMSLTVSLQRYGQNERSLFSFLTTDEHLGLPYFRKNQGSQPYLNLVWVYNYLIHNFNSVLTSKHNPDFFRWTIVRNTIERVYTHCTERVDELLQLTKVIGLLDVVGSDAAMIDADFLEMYAQTCLGMTNVKPLIEQLEAKKIILYQSFKKRFKLFEGTDENIEQLLQIKKHEVQLSKNLIPELKKYFTEQYFVAKAVSYTTGTPRIFEVKISDAPIPAFKETNGEIDGYVNLIFSEQPFDYQTLGFDEPILYGVYRNVQSLKYKIKDILAGQKAIEYVTTKNDNTAKKELEEWLISNQKDLNHTINIQLFGEKGGVDWYHGGKKVEITHKKTFNRTLSNICETVYNATPHYRNELINRVLFSGNIAAARKEFLSALYEQSPINHFGFDLKEMPPEKMIYMTLCLNTKIFDIQGDMLLSREPIGNESFMPLWKTCMDFLESTKSGKRPLIELFEQLYQKPFRLKSGFIDFWILAFLRVQRDEIAIFKNGNYVPKVGKDVAELFFKEAKNFDIKKFNIEGVRLSLFNKYREVAQQGEKEVITNSSFQETAKPFLQFYKKLPKYAQETKSVGQDCIAFVKTLRQAKDLERLFFEDLPIALGTNIERLNESETELNEFAERVQACIQELRIAYDNLIDRIEAYILKIFGIENKKFNEYQKWIQDRYAPIKEYRLLPRQKSFFMRVKTALPDKTAWLNSLAQLLLNKQLTEISDSEEILLYDRLAMTFKELDDSIILNEMTFDKEKEQVVRLKITNNDNISVQKNVFVAKNQAVEVEELAKKIEKLFKDVSPNIRQAVLIKLLNIEN